MYVLSGTTPLQLACASGQLSTVDLLIEYGSDIKTIKVGGAQPVHQAAASGCVPVLERLLQGGADVNAPSDTGRFAINSSNFPQAILTT